MRVSIVPYTTYLVPIGFCRHRKNAGNKDYSNCTSFVKYPEEEYVIGACGEGAVCIALGYNPTKYVLCLDKPDKGPDLRLPIGTFEVKTPMKHHRPKNKNFIRRKGHQKQLNADYAALVWPIKDGVMKIAGYLTRLEYNSLVRWADHIPKPGWFVGYESFHPITDLFEIV